MKPDHNTPVYQRFIRTLKLGLQALDNGSQSEVAEFLKSCQHTDGRFVDRAGKPDWYYSLFGVLMASAIDDQTALPDIKESAFKQQESELTSIIDRMSLMLIRIILSPVYKGLSDQALFKHFFFHNRGINLSYQMFLLLLISDAKGKKNPLLKVLIKTILKFISVKENTPCSIAAAVCFARKETGLNYYLQREQLMAFFDEEKGFKTFIDAPSGDLLSSAVAAFAMKETGSDMRLIKPTCLNLIENNYRNGAFLPGNGDEIKDLEYTFYGLLLLGSLH